MPRNTRLKPYTTKMAKIQGPNEGKTYSNIYIRKVNEMKIKVRETNEDH